MRKCLLFMVLVGILLLTNGLVYRNEKLLVQGDVVRLALAPVDPRALMQGDYMALNYALNRHLSFRDIPPNGRVIVTLNQQRVAVMAEWDHGQPLAPDQHYLQIHRGNQQLSIGSDAWFFQEGQGEYFAQARYGELRVAPDGTARLTHLLDGQLNSLTAP